MTGPEFVGRIVTGITGSPDCYEVTQSIDEQGVLLALTVDKEHIGRVLGVNGATAKSIRVLLKELGYTEKARYSLKIEERV